MSETFKSLVWLTGMVVAVVCLGGVDIGRREGRAEMKRWQDDWYAAHPKVVYDYNPDGLPQESLREKCHDLGGLMTDDGHCNFVDSFVPFNQWIEPKNVTLDTYEPGGPVRVLLSKDGNTLYIQGQGIKKAPTQKPSKARNPHAGPNGMLGKNCWLDGNTVPCTRGVIDEMKRRDGVLAEPWDCGDGILTTAPCPALKIEGQGTIPRSHD